MPTARARHLITESDELATALDSAARRWPDASRAQLLARLALEGDRALARAEHSDYERRRGAVRRHAGALRGAYGPGYLTALRQDWPE